jgi:hypothetical protein
MTEAQQRIDEVLETYLLATGAMRQCPPNAPQDVKDALTKAFTEASNLLNKAIKDGLEQNSQAMKDAVKSLTDANKVARDALRDSKKIAEILKAVQEAVKFAIGVLGAVV